MDQSVLVLFQVAWLLLKTVEVYISFTRSDSNLLLETVSDSYNRPFHLALVFKFKT